MQSTAVQLGNGPVAAEELLRGVGAVDVVGEDAGEEVVRDAGKVAGRLGQPSLASLAACERVAVAPACLAHSVGSATTPRRTHAHSRTARLPTSALGATGSPITCQGLSVARDMHGRDCQKPYGTRRVSTGPPQEGS
eukprot:m.539927 g.539927  ORF g.539927 m.539927 type:complete len:137 (-) comp22095_c0_seq3:1483-1893(-)